MLTQITLKRVPMALAGLAVGATLMGLPSMAAADDAAQKLIETRRATALAQLKIQEASALAELKELQSLSTVEDWARHEEEKKKAARPPEAATYGSSIIPPVSGEPDVAARPALAPDMPRLVAVFGSGKDLIAALRYRSGLTADVRVGDYLETDHRVTQITPDFVRVSKGGKTEILTVYAGASRPAARPTSAGMGPGAPVGPMAAPVNPMAGPVNPLAGLNMPGPSIPPEQIAPPAPPPAPVSMPAPGAPSQPAEVPPGMGSQYDIPAFRDSES